MGVLFGEGNCYIRFGTCRSLRRSIARHLQELGPFHVPIVPMSVKTPVVVSMLYIEMLFEAEFVT